MWDCSFVSQKVSGVGELKLLYLDESFFKI